MQALCVANFNFNFLQPSQLAQGTCKVWTIVQPRVFPVIVFRLHHWPEKALKCVYAWMKTPLYGNEEKSLFYFYPILVIESDLKAMQEPEKVIFSCPNGTSPCSVCFRQGKLSNIKKDPMLTGRFTIGSPHKCTPPQDGTISVAMDVALLIK